MTVPRKMSKDPDRDRANNRKADALNRDQTVARGDLWQKLHPEQNNTSKQARRERKGHREEGKYADMIDQIMHPLTITSDKVIVTGDWHIPFINWKAIDQVLYARDEFGIRDLVAAGDVFDCDAWTKFCRLAIVAAFTEECSEVGKVLKIFIREFNHIWILRGNHEKRWIDLTVSYLIQKQKNAMQHLFEQTGITSGYETTQDDHLILKQGDQEWLICHPKNFRQQNLSVVRDLAAKHHKNVIGLHGHQFAQGWDRSGKYRICDGGGLFHRASLEYLRATTTHPMTRPGFYVLMDNIPVPFEPGPITECRIDVREKPEADPT